MNKIFLLSALLLFGVYFCGQTQISSYNHSPVIVGQQDLHIPQNVNMILHPDSLIIGDMEQGDYSNYKIKLTEGDHYSLQGDSIIPAPGYSGILYIPCQVSDGKLQSNTYKLEVIVRPAGAGVPALGTKAFYISPDGNDRSKGDFLKPFATLDRALDEVRKMNRKGKLPPRGVEIVLREGTYTYTETLVLDKEVSGKPGKPVIIRSYPGEKVYFEGGTKLNYDSFVSVTNPDIKERILNKEAAEKVLELDLTAAGIIELGVSTRRGYGIRGSGLPEVALAVNGQIQTIARYPNESYFKQIDSVTDPKHAFVSKDPHVAQWPEAKDIWLDGSICLPWEWSMNEVESIDPVTLEIKLKYPEYSKIDTATPVYHFKNLLEEIDKPGEYYIDRENGKLYYLPGKDFSRSSPIFLTRLDVPMLEVDKEVTDLWLDGIILQNGRSECIQLGGERNKVLNCELRCFSTIGITISGSHHEISGSHIHHVGMEAVILGSGRMDDRMLDPTCNVIKNTEIDHFSMWHRAYKPGLRIQGVGNGVSHCLIHHGPHMGINIKGNDHVFEYTDVHHTPEEFSDMLSIYIHTASDPQHRGTVIRRNYFHDVNSKWKQGAGVYMDNETYGVAVLENFFHNSGGEESGWATMVHGGGDNILRNNVYVDCAFPFMVSLRLNTYASDQFERILTRWSRRFERRYPYLDTTQCRHLIRYPELAHFFEDDDGSLPSTPYIFDIEKNEEGEVLNYWTRRTPPTNVFENNLVYNSKEGSFRMGVEKEGVREIREFYVVNGFRFQDGELQDMLIHSNNHLWKSDPGFVNYGKKDFTIRKDAQVLETIPGLDLIPFKKIGLR